MISPSADEAFAGHCGVRSYSHESTIDKSGYLWKWQVVTECISKSLANFSGLACGSAFINERFGEWLRTQPRLLIFDQEVRPHWIDNQVFEFEKYKKSYNGNLSEPILLPLYEKTVPGWAVVSANSIEVTKYAAK